MFTYYFVSNNKIEHQLISITNNLYTLPLTNYNLNQKLKSSLNTVVSN
ncbi:unnamed protein product [Spodoptera exigua]|nr:unnamed protein product [Spodoptera exigua]